MTFDGNPIFGAALLRTLIEARGEQLTPRVALGLPGGGSTANGPFDLAVTFTGRFIADTPGQLNTMIENAVTAMSSPPARSELIDEQGNVWSDMAFVRFEPLGPAERGRVCSLAFKARFVALHD